MTVPASAPLPRPRLVLFLGNVRTGEYETLRQRGLPLGVVVDRGAMSKLADLGDFALVEYFDFAAGDDDALCALIADIAGRYDIDCILNLREFYVDRLVMLGHRCGFRAPPKAAADLTQDKAAMHRRFVERLGPDSTAAFAKVAGLDALHDFALAHGYPLVLKPANLYGSLFVNRVDSEAELAPAFERIMARITGYLAGKPGNRKRPEVQVESFLAGTNHSIDCLIDSGGRVALTPVIDVVTGRDIGRGDFHHFARLAPSLLDGAAQAAMARLAIAAVGALEMADCIAHVEFIQTNEGPRLLEIAARPGGTRARMLQMGHGVDLMHNYVLNQRGEPVPDGAGRPPTPFAIVTPFPARRGSFAGIRGLERVTGLASYHGHAVAAKPGAEVGPAEDGFMNFFSIELKSDDQGEILADIERIRTWTDLLVLA